MGLSRGGRVVRRQDSNPRARGPDDVVTVEAFPYLRDCLTYAVALLVAYASILDGVVSTGEAATFVALYALYVAIVLRGPIFFGLALGDESVAGAAGRSPRRPKTRAETPAGKKVAMATSKRPRPRTTRKSARRSWSSRTCPSCTDGGNESTRNTVFARTSGDVRGGKNRGDARVVDDEADEDDEDDEGTRDFSRTGRARATPRVASRLKTTRSRTERRGFEVERDRRRVLRRVLAAARAPVALAMALTMLPVDARARVPPEHLAAVVVFAPLFFLWATRLLADAVAAAPRRFGPGTSSGSSRGGESSFDDALREEWTRGIPSSRKRSRSCRASRGCARARTTRWSVPGGKSGGGSRIKFAGATVMAWGASAGDLGGMLALARAGYARMGIAASLAGPVCQLSIGTGFSMLLVRFRGETLRADFADNMRFLALYGVAASVAFAVIVPKLAFALDRRAAFVVMGCYAIAVGVFVALALGEEEH